MLLEATKDYGKMPWGWGHGFKTRLNHWLEEGDELMSHWSDQWVTCLNAWLDIVKKLLKSLRHNKFKIYLIRD